VTAKRRGRPPKAVPTGDLADELRALSARACKNDEERGVIKTRREELIREALAAGWGVRAIAQVAGLSNQRISQLAQEQDISTNRRKTDV
jgi:hypothetical protein